MATNFLREFLSSSDWQQMQNLLETSMDSSILWVVSEAGRSVLRADEKYHDICKLIRSSEEGLRRCRNSHHIRLQDVKRTGQPALSPCYCGLIGFALPLTLDNEIIGIAGGYHTRSETPITMEKCAEISRACGLDLKEVIVNAEKIKHIPKVEQKRLLNSLSIFSGMASLVMKWMNRLFLTIKLEDQYTIKLSSLSEIGNLAASELDWDSMLKAITSKTKALLNADACSVYVFDQKHQELILSATDGLPPAVVGQQIKIGEGITGLVAKTRVAASIEDVTKDNRIKSFRISPNKDGKRSVSFRSILSVPLIAQDRLIGVIDVRTLLPRVWSQIDVHFLSIISGQIAGIIEKDKFRMEINKDLEAAKYVQAKLLPDIIPVIKGYDLAAFLVPSSQVGGDYYDFIEIAENNLGIVIADVSGKGIGAAILMASIQGLVNAHAKQGISTSDTLFSINNALYQSTELEKFATMLFGVLHIDTGNFNYTNAGHNPPYIYRANSTEPQSLEIGGTVLGIIKDANYSEGNFQLLSGDVLVLYSDGVTETHNEKGELFGIERLHKIVYEYMANNKSGIKARELLNRIYESVHDFSSVVSFNDDFTIVVIYKE